MQHYYWEAHGWPLFAAGDLRARLTAAAIHEGACVYLAYRRLRPGAKPKTRSRFGPVFSEADYEIGFEPCTAQYAEGRLRLCPTHGRYCWTAVRRTSGGWYATCMQAATV